MAYPSEEIEQYVRSAEHVERGHEPPVPAGQRGSGPGGEQCLGDGGALAGAARARARQPARHRHEARCGRHAAREYYISTTTMYALFATV